MDIIKRFVFYVCFVCPLSVGPLVSVRRRTLAECSLISVGRRTLAECGASYQREEEDTCTRKVYSIPLLVPESTSSSASSSSSSSSS
jgi:glutathionyl-hydroquinone reductase